MNRFCRTLSSNDERWIGRQCAFKRSECSIRAEGLGARTRVTNLFATGFAIFQRQNFSERRTTPTCRIFTAFLRPFGVRRVPGFLTQSGVTALFALGDFLSRRWSCSFGIRTHTGDAPSDSCSKIVSLTVLRHAGQRKVCLFSCLNRRPVSWPKSGSRQVIRIPLAVTSSIRPQPEHCSNSRSLLKIPRAFARFCIAASWVARLRSSGSSGLIAPPFVAGAPFLILRSLSFCKTALISTWCDRAQNPHVLCGKQNALTSHE